MPRQGWGPYPAWSPPACGQRLAYFISHDCRVGGTQWGIYSEVSSHWRRILGWAPQTPRTTREGWNGVTLPPDSTVAHRKQLFTWVRYSPGQAASS